MADSPARAWKLKAIGLSGCACPTTFAWAAFLRVAWRGLAEAPARPGSTPTCGADAGPVFVFFGSVHRWCRALGHLACWCHGRLRVRAIRRAAARSESVLAMGVSQGLIEVYSICELGRGELVRRRPDGVMGGERL